MARKLSAGAAHAIPVAAHSAWSSAGTSPPRFNREVYLYRSELSARAEARHYSVIVLQATDRRWVPILRWRTHT